MSAVKQKPAGAVRAGVEAVAVVESARGVGALALPPRVSESVSTLLGKDSAMLGSVGSFVFSPAMSVIGPLIIMKSLKRMVDLI